MVRPALKPEDRKGYRGEKIPIFSQRVRARRLELGINQRELAERSDVKQKEISAIEGGRFTNHCDRVIALARALETTPNYLFGFTDEA